MYKLTNMCVRWDYPDTSSSCFKLCAFHLSKEIIRPVASIEHRNECINRNTHQSGQGLIECHRLH